MARVKATARPLKVRATKITKFVSKSSRERRKSSPVFPKESTQQELSEGEKALAGGSIFGPKTLRSPRKSIFSAQNDSAGSISPSAATFFPVRRFSDLYGHGYNLEDVSITPQPVTGQKRRESVSVEELSPKRVRFAQPNGNDHQSTDDGEMNRNDRVIEDQVCEDLSIAQRDLALDVEFLSQPDFYLLTALSDVTEPLSISQISSLFRILQKITGDFAAAFFAQTAEDNDTMVGLDMQTFPLADLELKHHALYLTAVNVLDASTTDEVESQSHVRNTRWLKFFAHPNYRPYLVTAILSEWFTQRIFKDTAFGLSEKARKEMEEGVDKQYIYFDSFIRAKRRSAVVAQHRKKSDADFWLEKACSDLADELMVVLAPMLPFFKPSDSYNENLSQEDADQKEKIWAALVGLIRHCAALNLSVVRSGENGTVVRPANRLEKGKRYYPTAPMDCINLGMCESARDDTEAGKDERLVIKMSCWPRMEAWVPHGLDKVEMSLAEYDARLKQLPFYLRAKIRRGDQLTAKELEVARKGFCWDCSDVEDHWDVLPVELWSIDKKNRQKQEMLRKSYESQRKFQRAQRKKNGGDDDPDSSGSESSVSTYFSSSSSESDDETSTRNAGKADDAPRGAWVTEYTCLAPHTVYCEWARPESYNAAGIGAEKVGAVDKQPLKQLNSLQDAIRDAREHLAPPHSLFANTDDLLLKLWNFYASHNIAIEWGTFLVAVLVYLSRRGIPDNAVSVITVPFKITALILDGICEVLGVKALSRGIIGIASNMAHGLPAIGANARLHPGQLRVPVHMLKNANSYLNGNTGIFKTVLWNMVAPLKGAFGIATEQSRTGFSDGVSSMTHFVGQRQPFTTNPISKIASLKSAVSSAASQHEHTLGPAAAASLVSAAASFSARITQQAEIPANPWIRTLGWSPPNSVVAPVVSVSSAANQPVIHVEPSTTLAPITEASTVLATPIATIQHTNSGSINLDTHRGQNTQSHSPGFWQRAASTAANAAGDFLFGTGKRGTATITLKPGETFTTMKAQGDYTVV